MGATAPVVMAIIAANVIVFLLQRAQGAEFTQRFGTFAPEIADGEYWRLITAMFLHAPTFIFHILFNMLVLWIYGPQVEQAVGSVRFTALYFVSGFFASATSYALGSCNTLGVGASGAIFGIVGILLVYAYNRRRSAFVAAYFRNLLAFVGINLVFGLAIAGIDVWAHGGGLAAGVVLGWGFDRSGPRALAAQAATLLLVAGAGVALVAWRTATILC
jgi:membrane associated rhomboid family serine protease